MCRPAGPAHAVSLTPSRAAGHTWAWPARVTGVGRRRGPQHITTLRAIRFQAPASSAAAPARWPTDALRPRARAEAIGEREERDGDGRRSSGAHAVRAEPHGRPARRDRA